MILPFHDKITGVPYNLRLYGGQVKQKIQIAFAEGTSGRSVDQWVIENFEIVVVTLNA
jgi:hypothetical protein